MGIGLFYFMVGKLILIGGISRSGKSTLAQSLASSLTRSSYLEQDFFVKPEEELPTIKDRIDWDSPESIDWKSWRSEIEDRLEQYEWVIAEGIFAFNNMAINTLAHFKINLNIDRNTFLKERKADTRWGNEPDWFLDHVWHSHQKHHNPFLLPFDISSERNELQSVEFIKGHIMIKS